ncbi:MAG: FG-GAP-like repeat-containing protein [Phycisphaerae bacterium]
MRRVVFRVTAFLLIASFAGAAAQAGGPWMFEPNQPNAYLGTALAGAGDVNGDGLADLVVGAYEYNGGFSNEGRAYVFHGSAAGLSATPDWFIEHAQPYANFGYSVAGVGDVNRDGYDDVLIGARQFSGAASFVGAAYLYLGSARGLATQPAWTTVGTQAGALLGAVVSGAGDVNADGYTDLLVAAPSFDSGPVDVGRVWLYLGGRGGPATQPVWWADGSESGAGFGTALAAAGDLDGDGYADVLIGAPRRDSPLVDAGEVRVYRGGPGGLSAVPAWTLSGDQAGAQFGASVAGAGDVDGDGYRDVVIGAPLRDQVATDEGRVYLFRGGAGGLSTQPVWFADGGQLWANLGTSVAGVGDFDGDGFNDVAAGARIAMSTWSARARWRCIAGAPADWSVTPRWFVAGDQSGSRFGERIAGAGDVNGDGRADLAIGAWLASFPELGEGRAYCFGGRPLVAGDVNGDGRVRGDDVQAFLAAQRSPLPCPACDLNDDGAVDDRDVGALVAALLTGPD